MKKKITIKIGFGIVFTMLIIILVFNIVVKINRVTDNTVNDIKNFSDIQNSEIISFNAFLSKYYYDQNKNVPTSHFKKDSTKYYLLKDLLHEVVKEKPRYQKLQRSDYYDVILLGIETVNNRQFRLYMLIDQNRNNIYFGSINDNKNSKISSDISDLDYTCYQVSDTVKELIKKIVDSDYAKESSGLSQ